jgi:predicted kinase
MFVILMGIPGSGKTTYAKKFYPGYVHISSDQYLDVADTNMERKAASIRSLVWVLADAPHTNVVIDECNLDHVALAPYVALARAFGHKIEFHYMTTGVTEAAKHRPNVPKAALIKMHQKLTATVRRWRSGWPKPMAICADLHTDTPEEKGKGPHPYWRD